MDLYSRMRALLPRQQVPWRMEYSLTATTSLIRHVIDDRHEVMNLEANRTRKLLPQSLSQTISLLIMLPRTLPSGLLIQSHQSIYNSGS
jgi:hypothetical protein